ncbi:hypothetical protein GCM10019059_31910 [Camelimonas fluminis]|uniref:Minor tail protein n=1 Tax=Camelimonas fluminis TaxID=1576911 RepID=A0ABV7UI32_9HYPH|nr:hypothetical protein [Camelimonas fluminis]GHE69822.1 hypothetical protein GCM10019059_31910 [Camelimonas fluminis]
MPTLTYPNLGKPVIPWKPQDLFIYGNDGYWPDGENPADGRLFQDVAATIPGTTFGQPVGLAQRLAGTANLQQATAAARPTTAREPKGGRRNLLAQSLTQNNIGHGTATAVDDGPLSVEYSWNAGSTDIFSSVGVLWPAADVLNQRVVLSCYVKPGDNQYIYISSNSFGTQSNVGVKGRFDKITGAYTPLFSQNATYHASGIDEVSSGVYRVWISVTQPGNVGTKAFSVFCSNEVFTSTSTIILGTAPPASNFRVGSWQVERGDVPTPYQKVTTANDVTETGVPDMWSLRTDGTDDLMASTETFDVNKPWYFAVCAMIESSGGASGYENNLFGLQQGLINRLHLAARSAGTRTLQIYHRSAGGAQVATPLPPGGTFDYAYGVPFIVEGWAAGGGSLHCSINGGLTRAVAYTPGATPVLAPLQLGGGSGIAAAHYYDALAIQRIPSDAERAALRARWAERYLP